MLQNKKRKNAECRIRSWDLLFSRTLRAALPATLRWNVPVHVFLS